MNGNVDLGEMINRLTENPETMKRIMAAANELSGAEKPPGNADAGEEKGTDRESVPFANGTGEIRHKDTPNFSKRKSDTENLIRLLLALKPYVNGERREKIDGVVRFLKLVQLGEGTGILKNLL